MRQYLRASSVADAVGASVRAWVLVDCVREGACLNANVPCTHAQPQDARQHACTHVLFAIFQKFSIAAVSSNSGATARQLIKTLIVNLQMVRERAWRSAKVERARVRASVLACVVSGRRRSCKRAYLGA